jgi:hypothetical protein
MPPRSEFTVLTLRDNRVEVEGKLVPAPNAPGVVHWVVEKDGVTAAGVVPSTGADFADFKDAEREPQPAWQAGHGATAVGVHVQTASKADMTVEVTSFMWTQRLPLGNAPASG